MYKQGQGQGTSNDTNTFVSRAAQYNREILDFESRPQVNTGKWKDFSTLTR